MGRRGPGLLLRDLEKGDDPQIAVVQAVIRQVSPDILLLTSFDFDYGNRALNLIADQIGARGAGYPYRFSLPPNSGLPSGLDLDGDGRLGGPGDNQGFGYFRGSRGMALLSRFPIDTKGVRDFSALLWKDQAGARLPQRSGVAFPSAEAQAAQRLSSTGHWDVPVSLPDGRRLHLLASHPTPPVFDGPEDRNGLRNRAEILFWKTYIAGFDPDVAFVILGDLNADPEDGEGAHYAIKSLLGDHRVQDPKPSSDGGKSAARRQKGPNLYHKTDPALDTVDWHEDHTPGNLRVDYVLPSSNTEITGAGVFWPAPGQPDFALVGSDGQRGSDHRLVWTDIR